MSIYLGNITFDQVEDKLGYKLTEEDRVIWNKFNSPEAKLNGKETCFHVFDIPKCIHFKGEGAKNAIISMFDSSKIVKSLGEFRVLEITN